MTNKLAVNATDYVVRIVYLKQYTIGYIKFFTTWWCQSHNI